ncbi:MAG: ABC transporter substrate-binding protein [Stellaceae bacterium]
MRRRELIAFTVAAAAFAPLAGRAAAIPVIGVLVVGKPNPSATLRRFREELRKLGYVEGQNIRIAVRSADGNLQRLPALAAELVRDRVDVIGAWMTPTVLAAKGATATIPIVMIGAGDPVGMGIVAGLAHPGGNITGMAGQTPELAAKQVELLKDALPGLRRIAALTNSADPFSEPFLQQIERAGKAENIEVVPVGVTAGASLAAAFPAMVASKAGAVIVQPSLPLAHAAQLALHYRIPAVSPLAPFAADGGLMSYANDPAEGPRSAASFIDRILKGAKPADLPVEQPMRFQMIVNLKTAKALGLTLPPAFVLRADQVIE